MNVDELNKFLNYRRVNVGTEFSVELQTNKVAQNWSCTVKSDLLVNSLGNGDYRLTFSKDLIKYYIGYVVMQVNYLSNVRFNAPYLYFEENGKEVRIK